MIKTTIGSNAGKIWHRLEEGELTDTHLRRIKEDCQLKDTDFFLALGWLAREDKIKFFDADRKIYVFPNEKFS